MLVMVDLDGTLTDPYDGITRSVVHAFEGLDREAPPEASLGRFIGPPLQDAFAQWLPGADVTRAVALYRERFDEVGWRENRVYDGIDAVLGELAARGDELVVVTSKPAVFAERILVHFGLRQHFTHVVGATLDGTLRHKADLVTKALDATGATASNTVMVGDRAQDVEGAKVNGVKAIGVAWGYAEPGELEAAGADTVVDRPSDLLAVIPI
ncbi:MAG TPA: HAD hydrolase-like protein [Mycobacteriales bacterium]|nr:HAD hydrolase-like protein [Mycobacteriales bacterium]